MGLFFDNRWPPIRRPHWPPIRFPFPLGLVCELADRHGVELRLRPLPFGRKPYRMSREQLETWYRRYGFEGRGRVLVRLALKGERTGAPPKGGG